MYSENEQIFRYKLFYGPTSLLLRKKAVTWHAGWFVHVYVRVVREVGGGVPPYVGLLLLSLSFHFMMIFVFMKFNSFAFLYRVFQTLGY